MRIGDVHYMQFGGDGSEQKGWRPGIVFQNNVGNAYSPNIVALPLTSKRKKPGQPTHVEVLAVDSGLPRDSVVLCENPVCLSKDKVGEYITRLPDKYMKKVAAASLLASSAIAFLDADVLLNVWKRAVALNAVAV